MTEHVSIIGAGLGGLTCAIALARAGVPVKVYEQAPALGEVGAGITLSPNSSRVLIHLGLGDGIADLGYVPQKQWTQNLHTGALLVERERGALMAAQYGAPYTHLHRADLHTLLVETLETVAPGAIALSHKVIGISQTPESALVIFDGEQSVSTSLVIGADGVKSVVRDQCFETAPPLFTGQVAWRGIVSLEALPAQTKALPPGIWIGEKRLFMRYPIRGGSLINYAAFVNLDGWDQEGWAIPSTVDELMSHYHDAEPDLRAMITATPPDQIYKWALHARDPLPSWVAGRVTLLGDAAHAMLPFMGQGAGTAIEDGMVLARCLAGYSQSEALVRYEAARRDRTTLIQTQSRLLGLQFQGKDPASFGQGPIQNEETLGLFAYDALDCPI